MEFPQPLEWLRQGARGPPGLWAREVDLALSPAAALDCLAMSAALHPYVPIVLARAPENGKLWFQEQLERLKPNAFRAVFAGAGRRLGDALVVLDDVERRSLAEARLPLPEGWRLCDIGRAALLHAVCHQLRTEEQPAFIQKQFNRSDNREREAILKTLMMLPDAERFLSIAVDACRSHVQSVFEAIACENPYPSEYFPDANFNQLVLKAFFTGVKVERIVNLPERRSPELTRMANDYASERQAAGRRVPDDLEYVTLGHR